MTTYSNIFRCKYCNKKVSGGQKYCENCGYEINFFRCVTCGAYECDLSNRNVKIEWIYHD